MPRVTYADRFVSLLARPLSSRDRRFCESLQSFYLRKGRLTAGRARCVRELEERYSAEKLAEAAERSGPMLKRLRAIAARVESNQWAIGFIMSLSLQVQGGRDLSDKQIATLEKIERENNDDAMAARASWDQDYRIVGADENYPDHAPCEIMTIAALYYQTAGYFADLVGRVLSSSVTGYTPSMKQYRKMVENKFAQKVITASLSVPKYTVGSFVALRASAPWAARQGAGNKPCVVIQTDAAPVTSAARGTKKYKLLPIGGAKPIIIEERHIKAARKLK
jgi:hypothetical protein